MSLSTRIKAEARRLGFALVGILPTGPSLTHPFYQAWLEKGYAGEMGYLERHAPLKAHLERLAPGARSVIMLSLNYYRAAPPAPANQEQPRGRISRYAWGRDYHDLIAEKLRELSDFIAAEAGRPVQCRNYVDTAPVMEREFAARAGLGWVGKHGVLIHWSLGSWLFLAELLVDIELDYDEPPPPRRARQGGASRPAGEFPAIPLGLELRESCGSCTACIDACPTDAIVAEKTVDSRRCISYHTIELKGPIPEEFRSRIGEWVFGCDICQDVCPWNRRAKPSGEPEFSAEAERAQPSLLALLALDEQGFRERFGGTAILRTKRRGLLRNAAIALGNRLAADNDTESRAAALQALRNSLADAEPLVRGAAAWALGVAGGPQAMEALGNAQVREYDDSVRVEISRALGRWGG
ncbi:MAG: DUF1730 domain-containing protein [SAR324 cluster bacterium]|nr:DUF1730 domain-containing protein [SAR324 cluster bacterium]